MKAIGCTLVRLLFLVVSSVALGTDNKNENSDIHRSLQSGPTSVTSLRLINADTNAPIVGFDPVPDLALISVNLDLLPPGTKNLNIEAITTGNTSSVVFTFLGGSRIENKERWAYCGNDGDDFFSCPQLKEGVNATMTITPRTFIGGNLTNGTTLSTRIVIFRPVRAPPPCQGNLTLINAINDTAIGVMSSTTFVDLSSSPNISIRADFGQLPQVSRVQFDLDGRFYRNDYVAPYAFNGNNKNDYFPWRPSPGKYTITASPYHQNGTKLCTVSAMLVVSATRCDSIVSFINSKTLTGRPLSVSGTTQEEKAVEWLCLSDQRAFDFVTEFGQQSYLQRYVWLSSFITTGQMDSLRDVCDWGIFRCTNGIIQEFRGYALDDCAAGTIPPDVGLLNSIRVLTGSFNGTIPAALGKLSNLKELILSGACLEGSIPDTLGSLTNLAYLSLARNRLNGTIPDTIGKLVKLKYLLLHENELSGAIPDTLGNLINLVLLYLHDNELSGMIPATLGNLINLELVFMYGNELSGMIPDTLANMAKLTGLFLGSNDLIGTIPAAFGNLTTLSALELTDNDLSGVIPSTLGNLVNLTYLLLYDNELSGEVPSTLGNLTNLEFLVLVNNTDLSGTIPTVLCGLDPRPIIAVYNTKVTCDCCVGPDEL